MRHKSNLQPRVWDPQSPFYLPQLQAIMVSYADFHLMAARRTQAMAIGLRQYLGVPAGVQIYLDNGAFNFLRREGETPHRAYEEFVAHARPDWWPIPQDFIPTPQMTHTEQEQCLQRTMAMNQAYEGDGYVPVIHISRLLEEYLDAIQRWEPLQAKPAIALGGIVPNLLRAPRAMPYDTILEALRRVRITFADKDLHIFGIGGTATLHVAALLGIDSVDSSGWRNRAARGIVQLPGCGDRVTADLGSWRGRRPNEREWEVLTGCGCPACRQHGVDGLRASGIDGFCNRAVHNLWTLLEEARLIQQHLTAGTYRPWYQEHLDNTIYRPLIDRIVEMVT